MFLILIKNYLISIFKNLLNKSFKFFKNCLQQFVLTLQRLAVKKGAADN